MLEQYIQECDGELEICLEVWQEYFNENSLLSLNVGDDWVLQDKFTSAHKNTINYILENQKEILDIVLNRLLENYDEMREIYGCDEYGMPEIKSIDDYCKIMGAQTVRLQDIEKDGFAYYGIGFWCDWDEEHGLGVMMYKDRIVDIGGEDTSFLGWIAKKDLQGE